MANPELIRVSPNPEIQILDVGDGRSCAVVDNFLEDPQALIDFAVNHAIDFTMQPGPPGPAHAIDKYSLQEIQRFVRSRLSRWFPYHRFGIELSARLSLVTLRPEQLSIMQRICHIDPRRGEDRRTYAGLVYLFQNQDLGGTAFYRWNTPDVVNDVEQLLAADQGVALAYLEERSEYFRQDPQYMAGSNDIAEMLAVVPARFNRLVFYDGELPHSGHISQPELLTHEPRKGRLTLNFFSYVRPKTVGESPGYSH